MIILGKTVHHYWSELDLQVKGGNFPLIVKILPRSNRLSHPFCVLIAAGKVVLSVAWKGVLTTVPDLHLFSKMGTCHFLYPLSE